MDYAKSHGRRVAEVMSGKVVSASEDTPLSEIANILEKNRIKRVPILKDGKLVGIVSRSNLIQALASAPAFNRRQRMRLADREIRNAILARAGRSALDRFRRAQYRRLQRGGASLGPRRIARRAQGPARPRRDSPRRAQNLRRDDRVLLIQAGRVITSPGGLRWRFTQRFDSL